MSSKKISSEKPVIEKLPLKELAEKHFAAMRELRRTIHKNPELSFGENKTMALVASEMRRLGYAVKEGIGKTGLTAEFAEQECQTETSQREKPIKSKVGIRADMDALPITEDNPHDYCSTNSGVMHACGHDAHTACALGAAMILADLNKDGLLPDFGKQIRFLFQPAEESTNADGKSGASLMMEDGALEGVEALVGLHVFPNLPLGMIGLKEGALLAACDTFEIKILGKGGHGAYPEDGIDAIVLAAQAVQAIQTIISRRKSALSPCVLTLGGIRSTTYAPNIIAEAVEITGTARYFEPALHELIRSELERALAIVRALGGDYQLFYKNENPPLINDALMTDAVRQTATVLVGKENIIEPTLQLGSEDFSFYCQKTKACFAVLGAQIEGDTRNLHTPRFDIDEACLKTGAALLAGSALHFLSRDSQ
ncbi:MAG: amidohydrolase [Candidatus Obscuribacterales bacterium]|nr:amidohydrolase [Candidatus Obscuribacterales bacterium]